MTTTLSERVSQSAFDGSMLRVVLLMDLHEGRQQEFFEAYEQLRHCYSASRCTDNGHPQSLHRKRIHRPTAASTS